MTTICGHYIRSKNWRNYSWTTESDLCVRGKLLNYLLAGLRSERNTRPHKAKPASAKIPSKLNDPPPPLPGECQNRRNYSCRSGLRLEPVDLQLSRRAR